MEGYSVGNLTARCHSILHIGSLKPLYVSLPQESHKDTTAPTSTTGAADQTQGDFLKAPETLPCAQCRREIKSTPTVIEKKVCGVSFSKME